MSANVAFATVDMNTGTSGSTEALELRLKEAMAGLTRRVQYPSVTTLAKEQEKEHGHMSLEHALGKVKNLPQIVKEMLVQDHHKVSNSKHELALAQDAEMKKKKGIEEALDKVKETLAEMMEETQKEMDEAVLLCTEVDTEWTGILDQNSADRADLGAKVAFAKSEIAESSKTLEECKMMLANIKRDSTQAAEECAASMATQRAGLKMLEEDLAISYEVQNMTDCDEPTSLLQCDHGSGAALRYKFAGKAAAYDKFKSQAAFLATQRAAKAILKKPLGADSYPGHKRKTEIREPKLSAAHKRSRRWRSSKHSRPRSLLQYEQEPETTPSPEEVNKSTTLSDDASEALRNLTVAAMPEAQSYNPDDLRVKCTVSGSPSCPMLRDELSQLTSEVLYARDLAAEALAKTEKECFDLAENFRLQNNKWELELKEADAVFGKAKGVLSTSMEEIRQKIIEANDLIAQLTTHRQECAEKIKTGAETICGIKSIRTELFQFQSYNPFIQDCEVGPWVDGDCSAECAGGERDVTRKIVTEAEGGGAECPPMLEKEACNPQACPIDCVLGDWSEWGECSKDCGGGFQTKSRSAVTEAANGGEPCGEMSEPQDCNSDPCDKPCVLDPDWGDWVPCSKACDWGYTYRMKAVIEEAGVEGYCPEWWHWDRLEAWWCNMFECPPDLVCAEQIDMLVLIDGSGSVGWYGPGFEQEREFAHRLFNLFDFGPKGAKAGLILYSWKAEQVLEEGMTEDYELLTSAVEGLVWPEWNTNTGAALSMAKTILGSHARSEVPKEKTVVFLLTDGNPNDMSATYAAADALKEDASLFIVRVGDAVNEEACHDWASWPSEMHVLEADDFSMLEPQIKEFMADICQDLSCRETMTDNGMDYIGCQSYTVSGRACQNWNEQYPQKHSFVESWYSDRHLGDHFFCRNPDGDETIWCYTMDPMKRWEWCEPRDTTNIPSFYYYGYYY